MPDSAREAGSVSILKCGCRPDRGNLLTSATRVTPGSRSIPVSSASVLVECPMVYRVATRKSYRMCRSGDWPFVVSTGTGFHRIIKELTNMRVVVLVKANAKTEAGALPNEQMLSEMGKYNEELVKAGIMLDGQGLHPSSKGARIKFSGTRRSVVDGPFTETKELVAGFWVWQVKSMDEALEWAKRCPNPTGAESELEIRPVFEAEDFGAEFTPELREQEARLRSQLEKK